VTPRRGWLAQRGGDVAFLSTSPPASSIVLFRNRVLFSWPADHTGWQLQMNTNLSTTNWQGVAGTDATKAVSMPLNNSSVFFRLVYP